MDALLWIVSLVSLALAAVAYWRAGGRQEVDHLRRELERELDALRSKQKELSESIAQRIALAYEASGRRLQLARESLHQLKQEAVEEVQGQVQRAQEQLEALGRRLEEGARSAKDATLTTARNLQEAIALRVRRLEARTTLLRAKAKALRAVVSASKKDFGRTEQYLEEATELLRTARAKGSWPLLVKQVCASAFCKGWSAFLPRDRIASAHSSLAASPKVAKSPHGLISARLHPLRPTLNENSNWASRTLEGVRFTHSGSSHSSI
jgi:cellobiose-specific phosphotransferase system component IIA